MLTSKKFTTVPTKAQTEFASREEYPPGSCLRCANCGDGRLIKNFPADETQPDGVSPFCNRCDSRIRQAIATQDFEARQKGGKPVETREQVAARMRRAAAQEAQAVKDAKNSSDPISEDDSELPSDTPTEEVTSDDSLGQEPEAEPTEEPDPPEAEPQEAAKYGDRSAALNSGQMTDGARLRIEAEGFDLSQIPGRKDDGKVGIPEVEAWLSSQELYEEVEDEDED